MRSFSALVVALSLAPLSSARVTNTPSELSRRDASSESSNLLAGWFNKLFKKATATCYEDEYYNFVSNSSFGENFCQAFVSYPNTTVTVAYTPITTSYHTYSTTYIATSSVITTIPQSTTALVVTGGNAKRDAAPVPTPAPRSPSNLDVIDAGFDTFRRQNELNGSSVDSETMSASFSSACRCQTYGGTVVTTTSTASPSIITRSAFEQATTTTSRTVTTGTTTAYMTVSPNAPAASVSSTSTSSSEGPAPTAPGFQCPENSNTTVSQLVGPERYDYLVLCDTDISDDDFYGVLSYNSFSECAAACSVANQRFDQPVCQAFSFYDTPSDPGYNCFLKATSNSTVSAVGVDSGILLRIAVGLSGTDPSGTNTESTPFGAEQTSINPTDASSSLSQILTGSSTTISIITPGPQIPASGLLVNAVGETSHSTYVSDGSTYSSGTVFYTSWNSSGVWYVSYYSTWTQSWASATTVYASSQSSTSVSNSSTSSTSVENGGPNGEYWEITTTNTTSYFPGGYNVTQVVTNETHAADGTELGAATTTYYFSYSTGGASSGGSGAGGENGVSGASAGLITSGTVSSTVFSTALSSAWSTQSVISGGGATSGGGGGGAAGGGGSGVPSTATPSPSASVIFNSFGTAYSSGYLISGQVFGNGGASSTLASGAVVSSAVVVSGGGSFSPTSSTSGAFGTGGSGSGLASGVMPFSGALFTPIASTSGATGIGGASGVLFSGVVPSSGAPPSSISSTSAGTGIGGVSSSVASGSFSNSNDNRSGTLSTRIPLPNVSVNSAAPALSGTGPSSVPFSAPTGPRSGSLPASGSAPSGTAPAPTGTAPATSPIFPTGTWPTTPPFPTGTSPTSSCVTNFLGTTTIFTTVTEYGCYSNCPPAGFGGYGDSPLTFGPPAQSQGAGYGRGY